MARARRAPFNRKGVQNRLIAASSSSFQHQHLSGVEARVFAQFQKNPEHFIAEASRIISEQKATMIIERLSYDKVTDHYGVDIFTANQTSQVFSSRASATLKNHVYDYVVTDSDIERRFVEELDTSTEVVV